MHLREGSRIFIFCPQNSTDALSRKGKSVVSAPSSGRQSTDASAPSMKGKSAIGAPSMKGKRIILPKEGKRQKQP